MADRAARRLRHACGCAGRAGADHVFCSARERWRKARQTGSLTQKLGRVLLISGSGFETLTAHGLRGHHDDCISLHRRRRVGGLPAATAARRGHAGRSRESSLDQDDVQGASFGRRRDPRSARRFPAALSTDPAVVINVALLALFGLQHSGMARVAFKAFSHAPRARTARAHRLRGTWCPAAPVWSTAVMGHHPPLRPGPGPVLRPRNRSRFHRFTALRQQTTCRYSVCAVSDEIATTLK
jgi:hypothetical protein